MRPQGVLVTSASAKIAALAAIRDAMTRTGCRGPLWAADTDSGARSRYFADKFWVMPPLSELSADEFIRFCVAHAIGAVIPTRDGELEYFATSREAFEQAGVRVMISSATTVALCVDKLRFAEWGLAHGYPVIPAAADVQAAFGDSLVIKERYGAGARGVRLRVRPSEAMRSASGLSNPVFQPCITGVEFSVDAYLTRRGYLKGVVPRTRDVVVAGESKVTTTILDDEIQAVIGALVRDLAVTYHSVVQALRAADGRLWILECNCRFGGASTLAVAAGLDSFAWFLSEDANSELDSTSALLTAQTLRQVRYETDRVIEVGPDDS